MSRMTKAELAGLRRIVRLVKMERASFGCCVGMSEDDPLPKSEEEVTEFIRRRTRLYFESWALPVLRELIARGEGRKVSPGERVLDLIADDRDSG